MLELYEQYISAWADELVEILDQAGQPFMVASLAQAHRQRLRYQVAVCLLYSPGGLLYLQQRSAQSPFLPGFWDVSGVTAIRAGEAASDAASRILYEDLRVKPSNCLIVSRECSDSVYGKHDVIVFQALAPSQSPAPDSRGISNLICLNQKELQLVHSDFPDQLSPILQYVIERGLAFTKAAKPARRGNLLSVKAPSTDWM